MASSLPPGYRILYNIRQRKDLARGKLSYLRNIFQFKIENISENLYLVTNRRTGLGLYFPFKHLDNKINTQLGFFREKEGFFAHYIQKYLYSGFVIPKDWDVVDCGAYIGGFSLAVREERIGRVFAIEPSPYNFQALKNNISAHDTKKTISAHNVALGSASGLGTLHISVTGQDDSILGVDESLDNFHLERTVEIQTFHEFALFHCLNLDKTFLKVEAEGAEIQVLEGMGQSLPKAISLDVSAEMFGKSPVSEVMSYLTSRGFICQAPTIGIHGEPIALFALRT
jgi:FkbM family methyltransferase